MKEIVNIDKRTINSILKDSIEKLLRSKGIEFNNIKFKQVEENMSVIVERKAIEKDNIEINIDESEESEISFGTGSKVILIPNERSLSGIDIIRSYGFLWKAAQFWKKDHAVLFNEDSKNKLLSPRNKVKKHSYILEYSKVNEERFKVLYYCSFIEDFSIRNLDNDKKDLIKKIREKLNL